LSPQRDSQDTGDAEGCVPARTFRGCRQVGHGGGLGRIEHRTAEPGEGHREQDLERRAGERHSPKSGGAHQLPGADECFRPDPIADQAEDRTEALLGKLPDREHDADRAGGPAQVIDIMHGDKWDEQEESTPGKEVRYHQGNNAPVPLAKAQFSRFGNAAHGTRGLSMRLAGGLEQCFGFGNQTGTWP